MAQPNRSTYELIVIPFTIINEDHTMQSEMRYVFYCSCFRSESDKRVIHSCLMSVVDTVYVVCTCCEYLTDMFDSFDSWRVNSVYLRRVTCWYATFGRTSCCSVWYSKPSEKKGPPVQRYYTLPIQIRKLLWVKAVAMRIL